MNGLIANYPGKVAASVDYKMVPFEDDANNGGLVWHTLVAGTLAERGRIRGGNFGFGQADPIAKVDVNGNMAQNSVAAGNLSGSVALNCALGNVFTGTLTGAWTPTFSGIPAGRVFSGLLFLTNGGAFAVNWSSNAAIKFSLGMQPALTVSGLDILRFISIDGGATIHVALVQQGSA